MKKIFSLLIAVLLVVVLFVGCDSAEDTESASGVAETVAPNVTDANIDEGIVLEGDAAYYVKEVYAAQIQRYYTALSEQWDEGKYFENNMSALPYYYYEGNPLDNVGFGLVDLDNDKSPELIIGAILNQDKDPAVFEIWTLVDGKPVMLAQGGSRNRYVLQYVAEDDAWYVANEGSNSAANSGTFYLMLNEGRFEIVQGIVFDAMADEQNPWFMTYDLDWDVSNDIPITADMADAILESNRMHYTAADYYPYSLYR